jgi:CheY-like chemotaxis protein
MKQQKILLVDDDPDFILTMRAVLEECGYNVAHANDAKSGLELLETYDPDLVVLDVMMPFGTEGLDATITIRKDPKHARLPILMLSSIAAKHPHTFAQQKDEMYLPYERFVNKPVSPELLLKEVSDLLAQNQSATG